MLLLEYCEFVVSESEFTAENFPVVLSERGRTATVRSLGSDRKPHGPALVSVGAGNVVVEGFVVLPMRQLGVIEVIAASGDLGRGNTVARQELRQVGHLVQRCRLGQQCIESIVLCTTTSPCTQHRLNAPGPVAEPLVDAVTESGANVFPVDYFGRTAYLAQSPQFFKQQLVGVFERVYEVGPVFRAEPHDTVRHLAEYVSLDAELGFIRDHRDVLTLLHQVLVGMLEGIRAESGEALDRLDVALPAIPDEIPVIHFLDALKLVGAPEDEPDLAPAHERALGEWAREKHGSDVLAVEGYPMRKRPFYTHPQPDDSRWSNSFDLIFRGLELVTGGQRLHRYSDYIAAIEGRGESPDAYAAYLSAFEHGMPPHGGFAIGLERWLSRLIEASNIREVTLFPRDLHRLTP